MSSLQIGHRRRLVVVVLLVLLVALWNLQLYCRKAKNLK